MQQGQAQADMKGSQPGDAGTLIRAQGLACRRGGRLLFTGLDFSVQAGQSLWLRGANGIGKSSLLRCIAGLLPLAGGTLEQPGPLALVDDHLPCDFELPLMQALAFWARFGPRGTATARREIVVHAMDALAIAHLGDVPVRHLSSGQRQRAKIALAMISGAPLWLLDEPWNALDVAGCERLDGVIAAHLAAGGAALIAAHGRNAGPGEALIDLGRYAVDEDAADPWWGGA